MQGSQRIKDQLCQLQVQAPGAQAGHHLPGRHPHQYSHGAGGHSGELIIKGVQMSHCDKSLLKTCDKTIPFNHGFTQEIFQKHDRVILLIISLRFLNRKCVSSNY